MNQSMFVRAMLVPAAVWLSVTFGGSTGTGREVVAYVSSNGPVGGLLAALIVALVYGVGLALCFELARLYRAYDYRLFSKILLGRAWPLYEMVLVVAMLLTLAIASTAAGAVLEERFGLSRYLGVGILLAVVTLMTYLGREVVEKTMAAACITFFIVVAIVVAIVWKQQGETVLRIFTEQPQGSLDLLGTLKYAFVVIAFAPMLLYCAREIRSTKESVMGGLFAGVAGAFPVLILHFIFMAGYPEVLDQRLPAYWIMERVVPPWFLDVYVVVIFVLIVQTGVGLLQGFVERVDNWLIERKGKGMEPVGHAMLSVLVTIACLLLSTLGIVALISRGYNILIGAFLVTFLVPLITVGVRRLCVRRGDYLPSFYSS